MRHHAETEPTGAGGIYRSQTERDEASEARYEYDRSDHSTILGYIHCNADHLVRQFFEWRQEHPGDTIREALQRWEVATLGDRLFESAHRMLLFFVLRSLAPGEQKREREVRRPTLSPERRQSAYDEAVGRAAREHSMPQPTTAETGVVRAW